MAWYEIGFQRDLTPLYFKLQSAISEWLIPSSKSSKPLLPCENRDTSEPPRRGAGGGKGKGREIIPARSDLIAAPATHPPAGGNAQSAIGIVHLSGEPGE